jgi:uncharacterized membrane protein
MMYGWSMGLDAWLWMGVWILVLVALVWLLVREPRRADRDEAMEALRARLARGEISADEFERARQLLEPRRPQENPR